ncbi:protein translocase subunit SecD [Galbitalea sp. SE-J8]|uniref:protein translocase subunit SecD n=1 Tax=Galbitalea sp. SE-J8 TaxID=3054952 RepID=UPI00259C7A73|nr:protein translocase subunit SecD [Galbitalea sp. SE-J8]MDM4763239.1 protein translocase subunit SecD [Galbitalea sp. SE-J8]
MAARSTPVRKAWRSLIWLAAIIAVLAGVNAYGVLVPQESTWAPKLALDLQGGTELILAPQVEGGAAATQEQLDQAVAIIRQRVDATGVSESEINTSGNNIVVSLPGNPSETQLSQIEASAKLEFRPVLVAGDPATSSVGGDGSTASPSPSPSESLSTTPTATPTDASDPSYVTPALQAQYDSFDCSTIDPVALNTADPKQPIVTCDPSGSEKYVLGPVEVSGERIADASNGVVTTQTGASTGTWAVNIVFDSEGAKEFSKVTTRLYGYLNTDPTRNRFAIVLDGRVISAPSTNAVITDGKPQITGSFTEESSKALADQLKYGALPISFQVQSQDKITSTLGSTQLQSGLIAGAIGLLLVIIYSLFQYRLLGTVTIASLVVVAAITYFVILILGWRQGYRLSLAGVAGLIVSIGLTADSFIVYFERIRDELRDGRALVGAVEAGWKRALRTIFAAKSVNLLSAVILFVLAVGNVKGFALTLGVTTIIDVLVVVLFTHPVLQLLASTRFFSSGHPITGLDPNALGAVYRGRAQFRDPRASGRAGAAREAERRQTIAERKAGIDPTSANDGKES